MNDSPLLSEFNNQPRELQSIRAAELTPPGRGAVAVIGLHADRTWLIEQNRFTSAGGVDLANSSPGRLVYGYWGDDDIREDVVLCLLEPSRHELHCHGGRAAVRRILDDLRQGGAEIVSGETYTAAYTAPLAHELETALIGAATERVAEVILRQMNGQLTDALTAITQLPVCNSERWQRRSVEALDRLLRWSPITHRLSQPARVVICGRPNVGKSSLINHLLGYERAIVYDQPGTTRDVVTARTAFDGWPVELLDTAGLRDGTDSIECTGIALAKDQIDRADLVILVLDRAERLTEIDQKLIGELPTAIRIAHKSDRPDAWEMAISGDALAVSSLTGDGIAELIDEIGRRLAPDIPPPDEPVAVTLRQLHELESAKDAAEKSQLSLFREAMSRCLHGSSL